MKMKVKKSQRPLKNAYSQFCSCIAYLLLTICLLELIHLRVHVNGYIKDAINVTNSFQHLNTHSFNGSRESHFAKRNGRFLFDALFGLDTPPLDASDFADEEDEEEEAPKPCKCGKYQIKCVNRVGRCVNCLHCLKIEKKACGQSNQETRIVGGKPTGVNVRIVFYSISTNRIVLNYIASVFLLFPNDFTL